MSAASGNMAGFGARKFAQDMYQQSSVQSYPTAHYDHTNQYYPDSSQWAQPAPAPTVDHRHYNSNGASSHSSNASYGGRSAQTTRTYRRDEYSQQQYTTSATTSAKPAPAPAARTRAPVARAPARSDTLQSSATDSTVGLAYAQSNDSAYGQQIAYESNDSRYRSNDSLFPPSHRSPATHRPPGRTADRTTVYDDDYEEPVYSNTVDEMFRASSPASATRGDESIDVSFTIVRATVFEPVLPKAKCADCGDSLDFEELANHTCQPASASKLPLLTIQVPPSSSSSAVSSTATSPAIATPRSPFFDRYDHLISQSGPASPALLGCASPTVDVKQRDEETPTAHAVKILGTHAAVKVSSIQTSQAVHLKADRSPPVQPPQMQRSASDTDADAVAAARRKMIEQQRAAKKKDIMANTMPRAVTTPSLYKPEAALAQAAGAAARSMSTRVGASYGQTSRLSASEAQHAKKESSSSISSTATDSSGRQRAYVGKASSTANITPSSSYERIESHSTPTKPMRDRAPVDLSSIEEMMKGLTASPEPLQRMLGDAGRSERERALELELERLRDKERTRQLQALRLKEKKRKERAAKRCCVCDCSLSSSRTPFVERDGKLLCARDWKELYLPKCRKCNLSVEKGAVKSSDGALRGVFHRACFACAACEAPFADGSFYVFNNQPYCGRHYHRLNGSLCRECEAGIEGDCRQTDTGDRFHPHCFSCQYASKNGACSQPLAEYYMVGGQRLCERHADKVGRRLAKAGQRQHDLRAHKRMTMLHSLRGQQSGSSSVAATAPAPAHTRHKESLALAEALQLLRAKQLHPSYVSSSYRTPLPLLIAPDLLISSSVLVLLPPPPQRLHTCMLPHHLRSPLSRPSPASNDAKSRFRTPPPDLVRVAQSSRSARARAAPPNELAMSYHPDSFVNSPTSAADDPAWQLHSSTDSYLNWDANPKSPLSHPHDATLTSTPATAPPMSRLRSSSSTATPSVASSRTPNDPGSADTASLLSHHGHSNNSPERPQSPSYFAKLYFQPPHRSSSGTSPTITFTGAPAEPSLVAASQLPALSFEGNQSTAHLPDPARQQAPARRSSVSAASNSPTSGTPLSPTMSSKSAASAGGFFASLRPSSPGNLAAATSRIPEGETYVKPRRPSSVFEHVGNVWERFGRKVHHTRSSTSEQQSSSSSHQRRTASQTSPTIGLTPEAADPFDNAHHSPSGSIASQASPSHSTATESECRTPATPSAETPASLSTPQPLPSAPAYSQLSSADTAADPRLQDEVEELPYLAPEPAPTFAQPAPAAHNSPRTSSANRSQASYRRESSLFERVLIQVTDDNERFAVVDISGVDSADAIKERMFAKLHLFDADHSSFQLFRTEIGQSEATGPVVNDDALLVLCLQMGDNRGTLKFLVQQTAPPNATVRAMPPPTSAAGQQRALNEVRRVSGTGSATSNHLRTDSQSSRSSISDALIYPEMVGADGAHEGSNRNSGSSLTRSKAQARRALPSAPPIDDLRSPTGYHDRRSIASSGEGHAQEASSKHASSVSEGSGAPVMLSQRSSSMNATQPAATASSNNARRPSHVEDERPRFDADASANRSLQAPTNGLGHRQERSDEGVRDQSRQQAPGLTLHNAKSMDDLHRPAHGSTHAPAMIPQAEVRAQAGLDRDGRYPAPSIMRPSTAAPAGPGARDGGHGHRQYSSDALGTSQGPVDPASLDPRMLQRNRSAQAAIPSSQQLANHGPTRMASTPQIRSPPMQPNYPARGPVDPRYARPAGMEDPRYAGMPTHPAQSLQPRPTSPAARPPQFNAPSTYGEPNSYSVQSFGQAQRPLAPGYVNEFGARAPNAAPNFNTFHGHDPRLGANGMQGSLTPRPYSYHEASSTHHTSYRPFSPQLAPSPYRTREDPFTTRYFPASSSRQVSEFQMQAGRLEPGMTVQQTLRTHEVMRNQAVSGPQGQAYLAHAHPPGPSYGPRDPRQPAEQPSVDRKRFLDRAGKRATEKDAEASSGLVRRRSTKLWGTRVVEMTPGQELATPASATSAESPLSDTSPPKPVFKWVKGDLIGKGTYGRVYLALNATTGEMIAVKQVELPRTASDREDSRQKGVVAALKSEIETLKDLDHPHIVSYLGFEETTTFLSIFLEYVPGGSVGSCLRKHGKFEEPTIKSFLHQILDGLAYLHSKGILHRDLKADNILVDFEGICKISDFGTVRRSDDIYGNVENMSLQGSIFWMAPEVVSLSKKGYSAKIDIWSLGCVVLEMFAGRRPWSDDEAVQAMFKIGAERKAPPIPADVKLSKQAAHFLKNCFEVDPAKRPTAQRLLDHVFSVPDESWHFQQSALWRSLQR
ncbi:hypothetical protein PANT_22d00113 [Moesziomyces antarcticus T-34]|uniref:Adaptor protein Enigma and related PDZ-LIM proteins n=1 Tax=Pseudozyma antarctica (strain T-34) TaxID=1151754 RepID=M9MI38_PSEA3|nr:hypothetical protein PANT_22d00113 [Moesziomyces antarcticus T-34]